MAARKTKKAAPTAAHQTVVKPVDELVGHVGPVRIKGKGRAGRTVYAEVHGGGKNAFTRKDGAGYFLSRPGKDDEPVWRWVEPGTKLEVLSPPAGITVWLPGDSWIDARGQQVDASGATVEIMERNGNVLTGWVKEIAPSASSPRPGQAHRDDWGQLDLHVSKLIIDGDFDDEPGLTGKPYLVVR